MASLFPAFRFGGDYNPEQWPPDVWDDDVRLMQGAGVTTVSVAIFAWGKLEPRPGEYDFGWLDDILRRLHAGGIKVCLATATASPPAWMAKLHPESLPVDERGVLLGFGSRQQYSPHSAVYREYAGRLVRALASRYHDHPALESWHVNNEYGCHVAQSFDAESVAAFRAWLTAKYHTIDELNRAWGTAFWSQTYGGFDEVDAPRAAPTFRNPTQLLDWNRFNSEAMLGLFLMEKQILTELSPGVPVTTNLQGFFVKADYWAWAPHLDYISDDAYPDPADPDSHIALAASRDLMRSLRGGQPWVLMEQSPSAVNWRTRNAPKPAGMHRVHSLQAVARGADGIMHFQWRQSAAGAEKFHAAMVPHAGEHTRVHREIQALGAELAQLSGQGVLGAAVPARAAIVWDWESWWALRQEAVPATVDYQACVLDWYAGLLRRGVTVDFVRAGAALDGYALVLAPLLQVAAPEELDVLASFAESGGRLVVTYATGVLDRDLHVHLGGYLGGASSPLQRVLGVSVAEPAPLAAEPRTTVLQGGISGIGRDWTEDVAVTDAEVVARFTDGFAAGGAAITRRPTAAGGAAWYVATQPDSALIDSLVDRLLTEADIEAAFPAPEPGVETVVRGPWRWVFNHTPTPRVLTVADQQVSLDGYGMLRLPLG